MAHCPLALKKREKGFSLIEALVVIACLGILVTAFLTIFKPQLILARARDARRKADLTRLGKVLGDYYNDHKSFPESLNCGESLSPYLSQIPCDPKTRDSYGYKKTGSSFQIYAKLENTADPEIARVGCGSGCGPDGSNRYNFGLASENSRLEGTPPAVSNRENAESTGTSSDTVGTSPDTVGDGSTPTPTSTPEPPSSSRGNYYGCFSGVCRLLDGPVCQPSFYRQDCYGQCGTPTNPQNECH